MPGATIPLPNPDATSQALTLTDGDTNQVEWSKDFNVVDLTHSGGSNDEINSLLTDARGLVLIRNVDSTDPIIINTANNIELYGASLTLASGDSVLLLYQERLDQWVQFSPIIPGAAKTYTVLTNSTGGTADGTLAAISGSGDDADINNNFTELYAAILQLQQNLGAVE